MTKQITWIYVNVLIFTILCGNITGLKKNFLADLFKDLIFGHKSCYSPCRCGVPNRNRPSNSNVNTLQPNEFPWLALIYDPNDLGATFSGTLINDRYILTSANNVYGRAPYLFKVKLGYHFHCQYEITSVTHSVSGIIIHPNYYHHGEHQGSDFALLRLSSSVHFNREINPICLPTPGLSYNGQVGTVASWDFLPATSLPSQIISCTPRKYGMPIAIGVDCGQDMSLDNEGCFGVFGSNTPLCYRDSGVGIFFRSPFGYYEMVGVLSDRQYCGDYIPNGAIKDDPSNKTEAVAGTETVADTGAVIEIRATNNVTSKLGWRSNLKQNFIEEYDEPLPVFGILSEHMDWIFENTKDSCYCNKP